MAQYQDTRTRDNSEFDLGHNHLYSRLVSLTDESWVGIIIHHKQPGGAWCDGAVKFDCEYIRQHFPDSPRWEVISLDPLTLSPSIRCHCGDHGWIRNGRWEIR